MPGTTQTTARNPGLCGTRPGYRAHLACGEPPCFPCCAVNSAITAQSRRRGRARDRARAMLAQYRLDRDLAELVALVARAIGQEP